MKFTDFLKKNIEQQAMDSEEANLAAANAERDEYRDKVSAFISNVQKQFEKNGLESYEIDFVGKPSDPKSDLIQIDLVVDDVLARQKDNEEEEEEDNIDSLPQPRSAIGDEENEEEPESEPEEEEEERMADDVFVKRNMAMIHLFFKELIHAKGLAPYFSTEFITSGHMNPVEGMEIVILILRKDHSWSNLRKRGVDYIDLFTQDDDGGGGGGRRF